MPGQHFDRLTRRFARAESRRVLLGGLAVAALSAAPPVSAKPRRNGFGCLDVGKHCDGKPKRCCSGICRGKRKKPGKKDKSRCVAHHVGSCQPGQDACEGVEQPCGTGGICYRTTGKAGFCGGEVTCVVCRNDRDCAAMLGPGAACVVCESCVASEGTRTACVPPRA